MPDLLVKPTPTPQNPGQRVVVTDHGFDWGASRDLGDHTADRVELLGEQLLRGAWFLCPRYTVYSRAVSAAFFRAARDARGLWLRESRRSLSNGGQRRESRNVMALARRTTLAEIRSAGYEGAPTSPPRPALTAEQRLEVLLAGHIAKQKAFSGVMVIDGDLVPPRIWNEMADKSIPPRLTPTTTVTRRPVDLAALKATGDPEPLKSISLAALQAHLDRYPTHAAYVSPHQTISASAPSPAFYEAAKRSQARWCILLNRTLGCGNVRRARRAVDIQTITLVFSGTLVVEGKLYLPGFWPNQSPKPGQLRKTPFQSPTVAPEYLGLSLNDSQTRNHQHCREAVEPERIQPAISRHRVGEQARIQGDPGEELSHGPQEA